MGNLTASQETLSELREQNAELTAQVAELSESKKTSERLESLLNLQSTYSLTSTAARIIGNSSDAWSRAVTIDKGTAAGFSCGMAVCNSGGVIGQIVEVSATTSTVQLITDEGSGVSAMIQSTRAQGMLQGQPDGSLRLSYVSTESDVKVGDIVKTTVFVKDLNDFATVNATYEAFFTEHNATFPARSCVEVARLPKDVNIEIEAIAVRR